MGLDTTHDCWHGSYGSFHSFRMALAGAAGLVVYEAGYEPNGPVTDKTVQGDWSDESMPDDPLAILLCHSDCDGQIQPEHCEPLAKRLFQIANDGSLSSSVKDKALLFADGLSRAAAAGEAVEFG